MNGPQRFRVLLWFACNVAMVPGCNDAGRGATQITVRPFKGGDAPPFVAVVTKDEELFMLSCPEGERGSLRCTSTGLEVKLAPPFALTIKSRGFVHQTIVAAGEVAEVRLAELPESRVNEDYSTGFGVGELDRFLGLSVAQTTELGPSHSVKFYVESLTNSPTVYFQNTRKHPLHYDFATSVLHVTSSLEDFELATYHGASRETAAGTLVYYPSVEVTTTRYRTDLKAPFTLNFFPADDISPELTIEVHRLIEERLGFLSLRGSRRRLAYLPAGERQVRQADAERPRFRASDAAVLTQSELFSNITFQSLNPGITYGTLRLASQLRDVEEDVAFTDILLLASLPNALPVVAGTITEAIQTPLSHVNVAARTRGTPNMSLRDARNDDSIAPYLGQVVRFEVRSDGFSVTPATEGEVRAFYEQRKPTRSVPAFDLTTGGLPSFGELGIGDALSVGAKAANLAELRRLLGDLAADGFAVPMSAYDAFMVRNWVSVDGCSAAKAACVADQRAVTACDAAEVYCRAAAALGSTLQQYAESISADESLAYDTQRLAAVLHGLRFLVVTGVHEPNFATALDDRIAQMFGASQVRLRSSTNAEDLPGFSGAGFYDSVSAFATGQDRASERIKAVWGSVWGFRAFQERRYWNVDHAAIRMGVAVNAARDDEVANGVLVTQNLANPNLVGMYVNVQVGELEVTNPSPGHVPEIFTIVAAPNGGIQSSTIGHSSASPGKPILSEEEVAQLYHAASRVQAHFSDLYGISPVTLALEIEFKFCGLRRSLILKQVRPYVTGALL